MPSSDLKQRRQLKFKQNEERMAIHSLTYDFSVNLLLPGYVQGLTQKVKGTVYTKSKGSKLDRGEHTNHKATAPPIVYTLQNSQYNVNMKLMSSNRRSTLMGKRTLKRPLCWSRSVIFLRLSSLSSCRPSWIDAL